MIKVERFLEGFCDDPVVLYTDGELQEVNFRREVFELPSENTKGVGISFEGVPAVGIAVVDPYTDHVVDVAVEEKEVVAVAWQQCVFLVGPKIHGGPHAGTGGAHGVARELKKEEVTPLEDVIFHNECHPRFDCVEREFGWEESVCAAQ